MTARAPRFEVVRTDAGWHARFVAANGQTVWVTESYTRRRTSERAIEALLNERIFYRPHDQKHKVWWPGESQFPIDVRTIDERAAS